MSPTSRLLALALLAATTIAVAALLRPAAENHAVGSDAARLERVQAELAALRRLVDGLAARGDAPTVLEPPPEREVSGAGAGAVLERLERVEAELRLLSERLADSRSPVPSLAASFAANPVAYERSLDAALAQQLALGDGELSPLQFLTRDEVLVRFGRPHEVDGSAWVYRWGWYEDEDDRRVNRYELAFHFDGAYVQSLWANDWRQ